MSEYRPDLDKALGDAGINPFPGAQVSACVECGGDVHIYSHISVRADGGLKCAECTRREENRKGRDPRAIDKHHKWTHGHDPADNDTDPNSPYLYLTLEPTETPLAPKQKEGLSGPPAGVDCFNCLTNRQRKVECRLIGGVDPYVLLAPLGIRPPEDGSKNTEKDIIVICPTCESVTHFKETEFKRLRNKNGYV